MTGRRLRAITVPARILLPVGRAVQLVQRATPVHIPVEFEGIYISRCAARYDDTKTRQELGVAPRDIQVTLADSVRCWSSTATFPAGKPASWPRLDDELLPAEVRELPADLATLDWLLNDPRLLAPIHQAWVQTAPQPRSPVDPDGRLRAVDGHQVAHRSWYLSAVPVGGRRCDRRTAGGTRRGGRSSGHRPAPGRGPTDRVEHLPAARSRVEGDRSRTA